MWSYESIELAHNRNWINLWLESDSSLVVQAFTSASLLPWELSNRWLNCTKITRNMNFVVSHVYRERNQCANRLANIGLGLDIFTFWNELPLKLLLFFMTIDWVNLALD
jgi:ribonuclease HI